MRLIDINDNPPEFEHSVYSTTIREDTSVGSSVMQVFATSKDTGINAEIMYDIIAGNEQGKFRMDSKTGKFHPYFCQSRLSKVYDIAHACLVSI